MNPLLLLRPCFSFLSIAVLLFSYSSGIGQCTPAFTTPYPFSPPSYTQFIDAATAWDISEMERLANSQLEKDYLSLFKAVESEDSESIAELGSNWNDQPKSALRSMAISLARNTLVHGSAPPALLARIAPDDPDYASDLAMTQAFANGPAEELQWNQDNFDLPLFLNSSNNPIVEVKLNGKKYRFWLDTGAGMSVISERVRKACKISYLDADSKFKAGTGTQKLVGFRPGIIESLDLGELTVKNHRVLVLKTSDLQMRLLGIPLVKIDGIVGWPLLKQLDLEFDFPKASLEVREPKLQPGREGGLYWYSSPFVPCHLSNGKRVNLMLDTGASETFFYGPALAPLGLSPSGTSRALRGSAGGKELAKTQVLRDVSLVFSGLGINLSYVEAYPKDSDSFPPVVLHGVLGQNVMSKGILRVDWTNRHLSFVADCIGNE